MFRKLTAVGAMTVLVACSESEPLGPSEPAPTGLAAEILLPPGFKIEEFARDIVRPRSLTLGDDGTVYVGTYFFTAGLTSPVYALIDRDRDYRVDEIKEIRNGWGTPNGIDYHDGSLFVSNEHQVWRIDEIEDTLDNPQPQLIYDGLPSRAETAEATDVGHFWRYLRYGADDRIYIPVGTRWSFLVGAHTANDLDDDWRYSTIVRMDPDGSNVEVFANGVRNSMGMDFHPATGDLYFTDNQASWPFTDARFYDIPPDEVNRATTSGQDFGFPYMHGRLEDPLIGSDAPPGLTEPIHEFDGHTAPLGMRFYTGDMFPAEYRGAIFVAEHGTEPTTPTTSRTQVSGDRISVIRLGPDGSPVDYEVFARITFRSNSSYTRRPVDLLVMPDGSLLVRSTRALASLILVVSAAPLAAQEHQHEEMHQEMASVEYLGENPGLPFSEAVRVGSVLYLSETRQTMENIKAVLETYGSSIDRVFKCTVFLADIREWAAMNEVYMTYFTHNKPARSAVAGSGLAMEARVEIECIATVDVPAGD